MKRILLSMGIGLIALTSFAQPKVLSHRGFYTNPKVDENTLEALKQAQELHKTMGLEACEFDVHKTADGELIICHNTQINKELNCQHSKWSDIQKYTLPYGGKIPTLRQWLEQAKKTPDLKLALELKAHDTPAKETEVIQDVLKMVREMDMMNQVSFLSFSKHACKEFVRLAPESYVILNSSDMNEKIDPDAAKALGFKAISYNIVTFMNHPKWLDRAREIGIDTYFWMCDDECLIDWATAHKATWITTDYADRMLKYIKDLTKNKKKMKILNQCPY